LAFLYLPPALFGGFPSARWRKWHEIILIVIVLKGIAKKIHQLVENVEDIWPSRTTTEIIIVVVIWIEEAAGPILIHSGVHDH
jgi:hypothetical protein